MYTHAVWWVRSALCLLACLAIACLDRWWETLETLPKEAGGSLKWRTISGAVLIWYRFGMLHGVLQGMGLDSCWPSARCCHSCSTGCKVSPFCRGAFVVLLCLACLAIACLDSWWETLETLPKEAGGSLKWRTISGAVLIWYRFGMLHGVLQGMGLDSCWPSARCCRSCSTGCKVSPFCRGAFVVLLYLATRSGVPLWLSEIRFWEDFDTFWEDMPVLYSFMAFWYILEIRFWYIVNHFDTFCIILPVLWQ